MTKPGSCPECGGRSLYKGPEIGAGGGHAPNYLPGLGGFFRPAKLHVVMCRDCGLTRFFAEPEARERLSGSSKWRPV